MNEHKQKLEIGYFCDSCRVYNVYTVPPSDGDARCSSCSHENPQHPSHALLNGDPVDLCPHCGNEAFYVRKDFPQQLGCAVVGTTVLLSSLAYGWWDFPAAVAVLTVFTIADFWLFHRLSDLTVCYRCHAELRGFRINPRHEAFDMHRAEEYEQGT